MDNSATHETKIEGQLLKKAAAIDKFERYEHNHSGRIAAIADAIAAEFKLGSHDRTALRHACLIHDIGEMSMKRDYINKTGMLREEERLDMHRHPVIGEQQAAKMGLSRAVQLLVRWHHEWWNGSGYPDALEHRQIPLSARILRIADSYAALTDVRPFSVPISASEARRYLCEWAGIEFDPSVVKAFLAIEDLPELGSFADQPEAVR